MFDLDDTFRENTAPKAAPETQVRAARSLGTNAFPHLTIMENVPLAAPQRVGEVLEAIDPLINQPQLPETMAFLQSTH